MRRLRWVADGGASEAEPRALGASFARASAAAARLSSSSSLDESPPVGGSAAGAEFFRAGAATPASFLDLPPGRRRAGRSTGRAVCEEFRF